MHIILETPRLTIRQFTRDDVDNLFELNNDPRVMRYLARGKPTPREDIQNEIIPFHLAVYERLDRLGTWAAESSAAGEFLGWFSFPSRPRRRCDEHRPRLPAAQGGAEPGLRHRGVVRPDQDGIHRPWRRAGIRAHDDG